METEFLSSSVLGQETLLVAILDSLLFHDPKAEMQQTPHLHRLLQYRTNSQGYSDGLSRGCSRGQLRTYMYFPAYSVGYSQSILRYTK